MRARCRRVKLDPLKGYHQTATDSNAADLVRCRNFSFFSLTSSIAYPNTHTCLLPSATCTFASLSVGPSPLFKHPPALLPPSSHARKKGYGDYHGRALLGGEGTHDGLRSLSGRCSRLISLIWAAGLRLLYPITQSSPMHAMQLLTRVGLGLT